VIRPWVPLGIALVTCVFSALLPAQPDRRVVPAVEGEMPDYTIAREYDKHRLRYPYIEAIDPEAVTSATPYEAVVYHTVAGQALAMDVYVPREPGSTLSVLLIHGGGWRSGHRSHLQLLAKRLAEAGFVSATVDYRTSRSALYPAGLDDIQRAMRKLNEQLALWQVPHERFALLGASSGAHMASLLGARLGSDDVDLPVAAVVNLDGVVETVSSDVRYFEDRPGKISYLALWLGGRFTEYPDLWREVSPLHALGEYPPATLFINSSAPRFHAGREAYLAHLERSQTPSRVVEIPDTPHTFWLFEPWFSTVVSATTEFLQQIDARDRSSEGVWREAAPPTFDLRRALAVSGVEHRDQWQAYFERSHTLAAVDGAFVESEDKEATGRELDRRRYRYDSRQPLSTQEVEALLSFQTPSGGWGKNTDFLARPRLSGQDWSLEMDYAPTFDNGATTGELRLLLSHWDGTEGNVQRGIERALSLILDAQMPSGGWPQSYPLQGGYHNWHTYNDGATANILNLLMDVQDHPEGFYLSAALLERIDAAVSKGLLSIVNDQLWLDEHSAAWGQQHDPVDHQLRGARSYELPVLATAETAELVRVLARRSGRSPDIDRAISAALVWLERHRLVGVRWARSATSGSGLLPDPAAEGLWPRFVDPESQSAIFADRDGARRDSVTQLSVERQRGYGWYTTAPIELFDKTRSSP